MQSRAQALHSVESTIHELGNIFTQLATMVTQQGELAIRFVCYFPWKWFSTINLWLFLTMLHLYLTSYAVHASVCIVFPFILWENLPMQYWQLHS